jgi:DNA primase
MARIPDEELQRIKSQVKVEDLCRDYGIELNRLGPDNLMGRCPFHDDHTPSFGVTPSKNLWNCLAGCGGGDAIELVMRKENVSFRQAVDILRQRLGILPEDPTIETRTGTTHPVLVPSSETELADHVLLKHVLDFYHQTFCDDVKAMRYLQARRCFDAEAVKLFRIGYANRTLCYRVPSTMAAGRRLKEQLQRLGIIRESGHEHLSGSVVFPILDEHGNVAQMYGRKITHKLRSGTPLHLYLPGEHRAVWNATALRAGGGQKEWLLCESIIDALTLWCAGFRNVTCAYGVNGFTAAHWALIDEVKPKRIVICYDNDEPGNAAAGKLAEELQARGIVVARAKLPAGQDINDVARLNRDARVALAIALETGGDAWAQSSPTLPATSSPPAVGDAAQEQTPIPDVPASPPASTVSTPPPKATPEKKSPAIAVSVETPKAADPVKPSVEADEVNFTFGPRQWRVRGVGKNLAFDTLRVQLRVLVQSGGQQCFHLDNLDLCNAKHRNSFIAQARAETHLDEQLLKRDLAQVFLKVEELQEQRIHEALEPKQKEVIVPDAERTAAMELLKDPKLLDRILADFDRCGVVGEQVNKLVGYLATISRKLDEPLAVIVQSASAAGKSSLMEAILAFVPEEQRVKYSAMTGQSLYYLGDSDLTHKVLAIVEEEGAERASYALKLLQSEGELTIASTGKNAHTGRMTAQEYHVKGPVMIMLTTTAIDLDEELMNRCIVLTVDESREQTRAIHALQRQRETVDGMLLKLERDATIKLHRNVQRLLRPLRVVNPYARQLTFLDDRTRTRRDHMKYLGLIRTIALLHQYQRPVKTTGHIAYIEATLDDIATANRIAGEVLGRSLDDLPPQTRQLLTLINEWVDGECKKLHQTRRDFRFSRRDVRQATGWGNTQLKLHLSRLKEMEYLLVHRGERGRSYVYELLYEGQGADGKPFLMGLIDVDKLCRGNVYDTEKSGVNARESAPGRAVDGPKSAPGRTDANAASPAENRPIPAGPSA